jgi:hypothetical protein
MEVAMELHLQSHHWERRAPDWLAAAVAGFAAGALLMVFELVWSVLVQGAGAATWAVPRMIAAIALGPDSLQSTESGYRVLVTALVIHYVLGIVFGMALAVVVAPFHLDSSMALVLLVGGLFGVALYLFNFYGMVRYFAWFADLRGSAMLLQHVVFGMAAAGLYRWLERRGELRARV